MANFSCFFLMDLISNLNAILLGLFIPMVLLWLLLFDFITLERLVDNRRCLVVSICFVLRPPTNFPFCVNDVYWLRMVVCSMS